MDWTAILGAVFTGGATGIFGSVLGIVQGIITHRQQMEVRRLDMQAATADREHEVELHRLNQQARAQETEAELSIVSQRGSFEGLRAAIEHDQSLTGASPWVRDLRSAFRPCFTVFLWVVTFTILCILLWFWRNATVWDLINYIVVSIVYTAMTAGLWFFGERALQRSIRGTSSHVGGLQWMNPREESNQT